MIWLLMPKTLQTRCDTDHMSGIFTEWLSGLKIPGHVIPGYARLDSMVMTRSAIIATTRLPRSLRSGLGVATDWRFSTANAQATQTTSPLTAVA